MNAEDDPETTLDRLDACSPDDAQVVSVYIPPEHLIDEVIVVLGREHDELDEGRSVERREDAQQALVRLQDELADYHEPPEHGMVLFCGQVDDEWVEVAIETPPQPIEGFRYHCDSAFLTAPVYELFEEADSGRSEGSS